MSNDNNLDAVNVVIFAGGKVQDFVTEMLRVVAIFAI